MDDLSPPSIAIIGAGPVGIEAALYGRYLGYPVTVFEQGSIGDHVAQWRHVKMFTPFGLNRSPLGLAALASQDENHRPPDDDQLITGEQWLDHYLLPLSRTDLVASCFRTNAKIEFVGRRDHTKMDGNQDAPREDSPFLLMLTQDGRECVATADVVLDASGTFGTANWLGNGGIPAIGERTLREEFSERDDSRGLFSYRIPSPESLQRLRGDRFAIIGCGYSAATNVMQLDRRRREHTETTCCWITAATGDAAGPMARIDNDPLAYRDELAAAANQIAETGDWLQWRPGRRITEICPSGDGFQLVLDDGSQIQVDHVLANVGFCGDFEMLESLQLHRCYASGGPMRWAASIAASTGDCLQQSSAGPDALVTTERNFFIIGSKTYGRDPRFLFSVGLEQIRDVFKTICGRDTLDLYSTMRPHLPLLLET